MDIESSGLDFRFACDFLKQICFERVAGTAAEARAAQIISAAVRHAGGRPQIETFPLRTFGAGRAGVEILSPYRRKYEAVPVALTGCLPKGGQALDLVFLGQRAPATLENIKGKAVYGYGLANLDAPELFKSAGAAVLLDVLHFGRALRIKFWAERYRRRFGIPVVCLPYEAGVEMVCRKAARARVVLEQDQKKSHSGNVVAVIKGTDSSEEIVIGGHYDSVLNSPGAHDNGGGVALVLALFKYFMRHPVRRTLRFVWFGGEELGLLGSQAYVRRHAADLKRVKIMLNIDGIGRVLDPVYGMVAGPDGLQKFVELIAAEQGLNYGVREAAHSSDSIPFSQHAIPLIDLSGGVERNLLAHTSNDAVRWCGREGLEPSGWMALEIIRRLGNARVFPFQRGYNAPAAASLKKFYENFLPDPGKLPSWCCR